MWITKAKIVRFVLCKLEIRAVRYKPVDESVFGEERDRSFAADVSVKPRLVRVYWHHRARPRWRQGDGGSGRVGRTVRRTARRQLRRARGAERRFLLHIINSTMVGGVVQWLAAFVE